MTIRTEAAAVLAAAALALTACSGPGHTDGEGGAEHVSAPRATAGGPTAHSAEEIAYLTVVRAKVPALKRLPDKELIAFAHASCDAIDAGNSPSDVAVTAESGLHIGVANSGYLIGSAVSQFCPEHMDEL
ncbi:DUF732 domain-containing protein [Streptomyces sp. NPDC005435]|uniref:DUF732 domain-containing protein n=1 Tax=Streptomyces sp. NPDC005435 TaxID=3154464 RepID=UPI0034546CFD